MICPVHKKEMMLLKTKYGGRFSCTVSECTVVCWANSASTPADIGTRNMRIIAHKAFDSLWDGNRKKRGHYYKKLSDSMGLKQKDTHIGMFSIEQCEKVIDFAKDEHGKARLKT